VRRDIQALALVIVAASLLSGCGFLNRHFRKENDAYKTSVQEHPLEVPPDLDKPNTSGALAIPDPSNPSAASVASAGGAAPAVAAAPVGDAAVTEPATQAIVPATLVGNELHVPDSVDSTWNRVGLAVERSGAATITARDEAGRTFDVQTVGQTVAKPGLFKKIVTLGMAKGQTAPAAKLKIRVAAEGNGSKVTVEGASDDASRAAAQALLNTIRQRLS
jgi:uncharacterized lipoprotein